MTKKYRLIAGILIALFLSVSISAQYALGATTSGTQSVFYKVTKVIDADTIQVKIGAKKQKVRLIGIDAPETKHPSKPAQCFGKESAQKAKKMLLGKKVKLESDPTNSDKDKYNRLLRYVYLKDGSLVNEYLVKEGYARAYVQFPFQHKDKFLEFQVEARAKNKGLWNPDNCPQEKLPSTNNTSGCTIKGNINSAGDKIYHVPSGSYYEQTNIDESAGEKWFCSEAEAQEAGWRKSTR